ncbi:transposase family protein [Domibacillus enclensis]|uniref:Zinc-finger of transposase IS204/IS1001/IS1096/IS1165 n=1 Tax=Domibacillus enclensis TaxID=1017273 RepID=A0A1N7AGQ9_9BACI|nr:transposase family protein [Domibacillus enclensis]OXS75817.1 hypothetical protein B1B05_14915 [Domibacillus enclensis]SIR38275.1 zinc-finger of transposase IS204/IS1001/IS1096/IS1165 [Domibacillus enclensis]
MTGSVAAFLHLDDSIEIRHESITSEELVYVIEAASSSARCPSCNSLSHRAHSRYIRTIKDLPIVDRSVSFHIRLHKWFCDEPSCPKKIFTERLSWADPYKRKTVRLENTLTELALSTNCLAAEKACKALHIQVSHDTLLRLVKRIEVTGKTPSPFCRNR